MSNALPTRISSDLIVVEADCGGVLDAPSGVQAKGYLVEEHREHLRRCQVQRLAGEEHLPSRLTIGHPATSPPVTELHEPPALDPAPEDDDHSRQVWVVLLDRGPRLLACSDECACRGLR